MRGDDAFFCPLFSGNLTIASIFFKKKAFIQSHSFLSGSFMSRIALISKEGEIAQKKKEKRRRRRRRRRRKGTFWQLHWLMVVSLIRDFIVMATERALFWTL